MQAVLERLGITSRENAGAFDGEWRGGGAVIEKFRRSTAICWRACGRRPRKIMIVRSDARRKHSRNGAPHLVRFAVNRAATRQCAPRGESRLGKLVTMEMGKIVAEGEGEVQEMVDICDFAVGQSRQLYGLTIQSERPNHRLMEQWHPLGVVGIISAFNFPVAVWSWNAALAAVCGDSTIWKPSEKTPLTAVAVIKIAERVCRNTVLIRRSSRC
jgi:aldehyde dehydrogenase (NAD+)